MNEQEQHREEAARLDRQQAEQHAAEGRQLEERQRQETQRMQDEQRRQDSQRQEEQRRQDEQRRQHIKIVLRGVKTFREPKGQRGLHSPSNFPSLPHSKTGYFRSDACAHLK